MRFQPSSTLLLAALALILCISGCKSSCKSCHSKQSNAARYHQGSSNYAKKSSSAKTHTASQSWQKNRLSQGGPSTPLSSPPRSTVPTSTSSGYSLPLPAPPAEDE